MNGRALLIAVTLAVSSASAQQRGVPQNGYPIWQERMLHVLFNRVRAAPTVDPKACPDSTVRAPLAWQYNFARSARFHSSNLSKTGCFQHNSPCLLHADISSRFPPLGTCDGSASCACTNAVACNSMCDSTTCTQTFDRISRFGSGGSGEIIAGGYGSPRSATTGWMNSAGHCAIILGGSTSVGTGWLNNTWTGNFGSGTPSGTLIAGGHEVGSGYGQFTTSTAQNVEFRASYYNAGGAPQSAQVNIDGTCTNMTLERGSATNGTYLATINLSGTTCRRYIFTFKDPAGATVVLPESGSYGVGGSLATCADWDTTTPPACGATNPSPTVATAASATPNPVTATTTAVSVLGADDGGEASLIYTWSSSGPAAVTFSANGTNGAKNATATFTRAGSYTLTVSIRDLNNQTASSSVAVTVNQTLTSIAVAPPTASVATNGTQQFTATARDQFAQSMTTQPSFTWSVSGGGTISSGGLFTAGTTAGGPHTVTATSGSVSGTANVTVSAGAPPTVSMAAAANPNPVTGTSTSLTVLGADDGGESALSYTWSATGPAAVAFSPNGTNASKSSTATFSAAGSYILTVTIRDAGGQSVTSAVSVTVSRTLTTIAVTPPSATVVVNATRQFSASGRDQFGNALTTQPTFNWSVSGGGTISSSGLFTAGASVGGPHTVTATSGGKSGTATVTVSAGTPPTVATAANASPSPVTGTSATLSVLGADDGGESTLTYTWTSSGPAPVSFSANGTNGAKSTTATFTQAGTYTFTVTITDAGGQTVTSTKTVTVNQTFTTAMVTPPSATLGVSGTQQFTATARDQFDASMTTQPTFTWSVSGGGTINASGLFTAGATTGGPYTVTASSGGKTATASVTISAGSPPTIATAAAATPNPVMATTTQLSALGADDGGEGSLSYTWSSTGPAPVSFSANGTNGAKNTIATFTSAGAYIFTVTMTDAGGQTVTSTVSVTVSQTLTTIMVGPASATVGVGGTQSFNATARDQFGATLATAPVITWTVSGGGTIDAAGTFTAGASVGGPHTVTASSGGKSGTATVSISGGSAPTIATAASANPNPVTATTAQLSVLGADDGGEGALTYTWTSNGPAAVTFSANATNAAKATTATFTRAGTYTFTVTITDAGGQAITSTVTVTVNQTLTAIAVTPPTASVAVTATRQFSASSSDQFGMAMATMPTLTWSVSGGGTISNAGLFTAGNQAGGPHSVTAANGSVSGTASVTVTGSGADTTPPTVSLIAPSSSATVSGDSVLIEAQAADDVGVARVEFRLDGAPLGEAPTAPYRVVWDTRNVTDGAHSLTARAFDAAGNETISAPVSVTIDNSGTSADTTPPTVSITAPVSGEELGATLAISAEASDDVGVVEVTFELDGVLVATDDAAPWEASVIVTQLALGDHTLVAKASDAAGNQTVSTPVVVTKSGFSEVTGGCGCGSAPSAGLWFGMLLMARVLRSRRKTS